MTAGRRPPATGSGTPVRARVRVPVVLGTALVLLGAGTSWGVTTAGVTPAVPTRSGWWGVAPAADATSTAFVNPYPFTFPGGSAIPQWVTIRQVGTVPLQATAGVTYALVSLTGNRRLLAERCSVAWNELLNTCGGTITLFLDSRNPPVTLAPPPAGAPYRLRVRESINQGVNGTLTITVPRAQARAGVVSGS